MNLDIQQRGEITIVTIQRPERRNAVDAGTARALDEAFESFEAFDRDDDRRSALDQWRMDEQEALANEAEIGLATLASGEAHEGARRFAEGEGRGGGSLGD